MSENARLLREYADANQSFGVPTGASRVMSCAADHIEELEQERAEIVQMIRDWYTGKNPCLPGELIVSIRLKLCGLASSGVLSLALGERK